MGEFWELTRGMAEIALWLWAFIGCAFALTAGATVVIAICVAVSRVLWLGCEISAEAGKELLKWLCTVRPSKGLEG